MTKSMPSIEIRIPVSPTRAFFHQVRFFDDALRRLGPVYEQALLRVVVGDYADMDSVRHENCWSEGRRIEWIATPHDVFDRYGIHGTADYRLCLEPQADVVVLADADTVWLRDIDPVVSLMAERGKAVAGHMAHFPPPQPPADQPQAPAIGTIWPWLFAHFGVAHAEPSHAYSMDPDGRFGRAPPYFNLGFIALSPEAAKAAAEVIFPLQDQMLAVFPTNMRCQIAITLMALRDEWRVEALPAAYNAANDPEHFAINRLSLEQVRVLHYLRTDILDRWRIVLPEHEEETRAILCPDVLNTELQRKVLAFLDVLREGGGDGVDAVPKEPG